MFRGTSLSGKEKTTQKRERNPNITKRKQTHRYRGDIGGCQRGGRWCMREMGEGDYEVQTSSYRINKSQGHNVRHREYSQL